MSEVEGPPRAVAWLGLVAAGALVSPVLAVSGGDTQGGVFALPFATGSAALAAGLALPAMRRDRAAGWVWVLLAGTLLCAALPVPLIGTDDPVAVGWWWACARGAAPVLVSLGLLGAGNLLLHTGGARAAVPVIACTFTVSTAGVLAALLLREAFAVLVWCGLGLGLTGLAAAIGIAVRVSVLRWHAEPAAPSRTVLVAGIVAAVLPLGLDLVERIAVGSDRTALGIAGVAVTAVGIALAARLGRRVLGAVLAIVLIGYGCGLPLSYAAGSAAFQGSPPVVGLVVFLVGAALGGLAAATRQRHAWAGAAAGLVLLTFLAWVLDTTSDDAVLDDGLLPAPLAWLLLACAAFALAAGAVAAAATIGPHGPLPVALGLIAPAIWLGLSEADTLVNDGPLTTGDGAQLLVRSAISGVLLLGGAVLMTVLRRPEPRPGEPSEPGEPPPA
ncbi:MAG TPA: hypothetical protein VFV67_14235 [Actinophytocola sp.]|uniref:hypothetical protein n=1 Tax=Actinophytocola sp. TaxID=1872138 RepID=UPI002DB5ACFA|nr:hypothetical protein [Actinophytocola sp.]HEU5471805.1 hypothetical protein [Actinophytocola sp.]